MTPRTAHRCRCASASASRCAPTSSRRRCACSPPTVSTTSPPKRSPKRSASHRARSSATCRARNTSCWGPTQRGRAQIVANFHARPADEDVADSIAAAILARTSQFVNDDETLELWRRAMASAPAELRRASLLSREDCDELIGAVALRLDKRHRIGGPTRRRAGPRGRRCGRVRLRVVAHERPGGVPARAHRAGARAGHQPDLRTTGAAATQIVLTPVLPARP